jgi:P-type E1-E2 ATPase
MIEINIPGQNPIRLEHLVSDVNGTLAVDGILIKGVIEAIAELRKNLHIHLLTADTFGQQHIIDAQLNLKAIRIDFGGEAQQKANYVRQLGSEKVVALGQGANDAVMLKDAALGLCVLSPEGTSTQTLMASRLVVPDVLTALNLLQNPLRIAASLRK